MTVASAGGVLEPEGNRVISARRRSRGYRMQTRLAGSLRSLMCQMKEAYEIVGPSCSCAGRRWLVLVAASEGAAAGALHRRVYGTRERIDSAAGLICCGLRSGPAS